jgi:hypothetical protein
MRSCFFLQDWIEELPVREVKEAHQRNKPSHSLKDMSFASDQFWLYSRASLGRGVRQSSEEVIDKVNRASIPSDPESNLCSHLAPLFAFRESGGFFGCKFTHGYSPREIHG